MKNYSQQLKVAKLLLMLLVTQVVSAQDYFQQEVNHVIQVKLNDKNHTLSAFEEIEYINNSPNSLDTIYMHLWPNAYKSTFSALGRQKMSDILVEGSDIIILAIAVLWVGNLITNHVALLERRSGHETIDLCSRSRSVVVFLLDAA